MRESWFAYIFSQDLLELCRSNSPLPAKEGKKAHIRLVSTNKNIFVFSTKAAQRLELPVHKCLFDRSIPAVPQGVLSVRVCASMKPRSISSHCARHLFV